MDALTPFVASKCTDVASFKRAKFSMQSAINTEQDLRDMEFINSCLKFYATAPAQEVRHTASPVPEVKKPSATMATPMPAVKSATADLSAKKSGLVNS